MEVSAGLRLVLSARMGPCCPSEPLRLAPHGHLSAAKTLFSALWLQSSRPDADELPPLGS